MSRYRARTNTDSSQAEVVQALRAGGASVEIIGRPLDLLVGWRRKTYVVEAKTPKRKRFQQTQVDFIRRWAGSPPLLMQTVSDVEIFFGGDLTKLQPTEADLARLRD